MAVTYGFYNSLNKDRMYNAEQMSAIFDGIITDGVFGAIGDKLMPVAGTGMQVIVKTGKCWFNSTWTLNDALLPLDVEAADVSLTRIDAIVVEINSAVGTRANSIKVIKGTPSANPVKPPLSATETLHQYALGYVTVGAGVTAITAANIEVNVGKATCPFITSVLQQTDITDLFNQWNAEFSTWFANVQSQLSGDIAANLQRQIDEKVNLSDKATKTDMENEVPGKWVDAAMIGGSWSIGDLKASCRDSLGDSWGLCDGRLVNAIETPDLATFMQSKVSFTSTMQQCPKSFPDIVKTSNDHYRCPTHLGNVLYCGKANSDNMLFIYNPNAETTKNTQISMYSRKIFHLPRLGAEDLYYFAETNSKIAIVDGNGALVSEVSLSGATLHSFANQLAIDQYGSILFVINESNYPFYGALTAIDFSKRSQTITVYKQLNYSGSSISIATIAIVGDYAYFSIYHSGSSKDYTAYLYFKMQNSAQQASATETRLDTSSSRPNQLTSIIPVDGSHMIFNYEYRHNPEPYSQYALVAIGMDNPSAWNLHSVLQEQRDYGTFFDGTAFYALNKKKIGKLSFDLNTMIDSFEITDLPKMPNDACGDGCMAISENSILHTPNASLYAFFTGLIARPLIEDERFQWFIKQK